MNYAGQIQNGIVTNSIIGTAEWASTHLGGEWRDSTELIYLPGIWDEEHGFRPMPPSDDSMWIDNSWVRPQSVEEPEQQTDPE